MRLKALLLSLAVTLAMTAAVRADIDETLPAIKLEAATLPLGDVLEWRNDASAGYGLNYRRFVAQGQPPLCDIVAGVQAVTFNGTQGFISDVIGGKPWSMPPEFLENSPYTVVYKVYNPSAAGTERVFGWTHTGVSNTQAAFFGYGTNDSYGAVNHWGTSNDMAFDRGVPPQGLWHIICVTYSGITATEKVYVNGELSATERKGAGWANNIIDGHPFYIGATCDPGGFSQNFSGSLAKLLVFAGEATADQMRSICELPPADDLSYLPNLVNNSFELVQGDVWVVPNASTSVNKIESRTIPGWAWVPADGFVTGSVRRGGIAINTRNIAPDVNPGNGWYDNGKNSDGMRVLALWDASNPKSVNQYVYLKSGHTYHLKATYNACSTGQATINVLANGQSVITQTVDPVNPAGFFDTDFYVGEGDFSVLEDGIYPIEIRNEMPGAENVLLVDKIELYDAYSVDAFKTTPAALDFGQSGYGMSVTTMTLDIQNNSGSNLDLMLYQRSSAANTNYATYVDIIDAVKPGTSGSTPNITILPYQKTQLVVQFTPPKAYSPAAGFTGELHFRWRAGSFYQVATIPWRAVVPQAPVVLNGSFEYPVQSSNEVGPDQWYALYGMGAIPNWLDSPLHGIGVGHRDRGQMVNNGTPVDGRQALWLQSLGADTFYPGMTRSVSQKIAGMFPGRKYRIAYWANARNQGLSRANWQLKINGVVNKPTAGVTPKTVSGVLDVNQVATSGNFYRIEHAYTATTTESIKLEFALIQETGGESALNIDDVRIAEEGAAQASVLKSNPYGTNTVPVYGHNFGVATKGTNASSRWFRIWNMGGKALALSNIAIVGPKARNFTRVSGATATANPYGAYTEIQVQFTPKDTGALGEAFLRFMTDDTTGTAAAAAGRNYAYEIPLYGTCVDYPYVVNPSFEQPLSYWTADNDWYRTNGSNIFPTGWATSYTNGIYANGNGNDRYGVGRPVARQNFLGADQDFFFNNGKLMDGLQGGWIQEGRSGDNNTLSSARGLRQTVHGFMTGTQYKWKIAVNARAINDNTVSFIYRYQAPGTSTWVNLVPQTALKAVDAEYAYTKPYKEYSGNFPLFTTAGSALFEFWVPNQIDEGALLIDYMQITGPPVPAVKHWSMFE